MQGSMTRCFCFFSFFDSFCFFNVSFLFSVLIRVVSCVPHFFFSLMFFSFNFTFDFQIGFLLSKSGFVFFCCLFCVSIPRYFSLYVMSLL